MASLSGRFLGRTPGGIVDHLVRCEQRPEDPGILVGDGHGRPVESPAENEVGDPGLSPSKFLLSRCESLHRSDHGPSSVDQKGAQIGVSSF